MKSEEYLKSMMQTIRSRKVKDDIRSELQDCIDDMIEAFMKQGMAREEAEGEAVKQMGDPVETGEMFNMVYRPQFEWQAVGYMVIWIIVSSVLKSDFFGFDILFESPEQRQVVTTIYGIPLIIFSLILSYIEKCNDTPFLWWKKAPAKHWAIPGLGVFGNSSAVAGLGIGLAAQNLTQLIIFFGIISILFLIQRLYIMEEQSKKEQKYIYKECVALDDFDFKGNVSIGEETHNVQMVRGETARKGDNLIVTGMCGFTLIVEKI